MNIPRMQKRKRRAIAGKSSNRLLTRREAMKAFGVMANDLNAKMRVTVGEWE